MIENILRDIIRDYARHDSPFCHDGGCVCELDERLEAVGIDPEIVRSGMPQSLSNVGHF